jgi:8-oxo-dGTP pyrophosphatase MutT (NUDIX family)
MESMSAQELADLLSRRLRDPASLPRPRMAPQLSYGRHRGPVPSQPRRAAVAVTLYRDPQAGWMLPLTLRPHHLQHHGGQICLPGGQIEAEETAYQAAIREFEEELGITPQVEHHCGALSTQYVYGSRNLVLPVVVIIAAPSHPWSPDPAEVHEVIPLPVRVLNEPERRFRMVRRREVRSGGNPIDGLEFHAAAFRHGEHAIWGATALILDQLARILHSDD